MSAQSQQLVQLSRVERALAKAVSIQEVIDIRNFVQAVKELAKKKHVAQKIIMHAALIKVEAERKLGQLLHDTPLANSSPGNQYTGKPVDGSHGDTGPIRLCGNASRSTRRGRQAEGGPWSERHGGGTYGA